MVEDVLEPVVVLAICRAARARDRGGIIGCKVSVLGVSAGVVYSSTLALRKRLPRLAFRLTMDTSEALRLFGDRFPLLCVRRYSLCSYRSFIGEGEKVKNGLRVSGRSCGLTTKPS